MKPTQKQVDRMAMALLQAAHPQHNIQHPENFEWWLDGDYHLMAKMVLRRIAAAERRGHVRAYHEASEELSRREPRQIKS